MITLRRATLDDTQRLFDWRNDPITCANSVNTEPVQWDGHVNWLKKSLVSEDRKLLVAEIDGVPVGTVRYDRHPNGWELSWTVSPEHRGRGVGRKMVQAALDELPAHYATIKRENIASQKIAKSVGFALSKDDDLQEWVRTAA